MRVMSKKSGSLLLLAMLTVPISGSLSAQVQNSPDPSIIVNGERPPTQPARFASFVSRRGASLIARLAFGCSGFDVHQRT